MTTQGRFTRATTPSGYVTHKGEKYRGKIPEAANMNEARTRFALIAANVRNDRDALDGFAPVGSGPRIPSC